MKTHNKQPINFEVQLNWFNNNSGILSAEDTTGSLLVGKPEVFGGEGGEWTPEHYFISAISSCFMNTFFVFSRMFELPVTKFRCVASGQIEQVEGKFRFTEVSLFPRISIADVSMRDKTKLAVQKAEKYCLISNSINLPVSIFEEITIEVEPALAEESYIHIM